MHKHSFNNNDNWVVFNKKKEDKSGDTEEEKATTSEGVNKKIGKEATGKERDSLDKKWKEKMEEEVLKLRSSLKEKLVQFGLDPEGDLTIWCKFYLLYFGQVNL